MMFQKYRLTLSCLVLLAGLSCPAETPPEGGVCFRMDDNQNPQKWSNVAGVFNRNQAKLCASLNIRIMSKEGLAMLKSLQKDGHEVMDHTPMHNISKFRFAPGKTVADYQNLPGVDHIDGNAVCLRFAPPSPADCAVKWKVRTAKDKLTLVGRPDAETMKKAGGAKVVWFPGEQKTLQIFRTGKPDEFTLQSIWSEKNVNEPERELEACFINDSSFSITPEALELLGRNALDLYAAAGAQRPYTWIQPGGGVSNISSSLAKKVLGDKLGYKSAATYPKQAFKVFGEYNPDGDCAYGMMWGNFDEEGQDLERNKTQIADLVALHHVAIGHSHMHPKDGWENYLKRLDELLAWCRKENIPVKTQSEWAEILYPREAGTVYFANAFPSFLTDRDRNGRPDGWRAMRGGSWDPRQNKFVSRGKGDVFFVGNLGGLPKGRDRLTFEVEVTDKACRLDLSIRFPRTNLPPLRKTFSLTPGNNRCEWMLTIPKEASVADFTWTLPDGGDCRFSQPVLSGF